MMLHVIEDDRQTRLDALHVRFQAVRTELTTAIDSEKRALWIEARRLTDAMLQLVQEKYGKPDDNSP